LNNDHVFRFHVNGHPVEAQAPPMQRLLDVLRDTLLLTGTKNGCGRGNCGACTVIVNGQAVSACLTPVVQLEGADVQTVENLSDHDCLNSLQQSFLECGGTQCGSCTPGILMAATAHLRRGGGTNTEELREMLAGNLCRCTGYIKIIESMQQAAAAK